MKKTIAFLLSAVTLYACTETEGEKTVFPTTIVTGEYALELELTQPFEAASEETVRIYNTANSKDSLWIEDEAFFDSKVKVKWNGDNTFSIEEGEDIAHGEVVNITGEIFPAKDSLHIEWRYLQGTGDPADDFVVVGNGVLFNGFTNN
jgi:hypothetical protein